jgi:hypothetical protein
MIGALNSVPAEPRMSEIARIRLLQSFNKLTRDSQSIPTAAPRRPAVRLKLRPTPDESSNLEISPQNGAPETFISCAANRVAVLFIH